MVVPLPSPTCGSDRTSVFVVIPLLLYPWTAIWQESFHPRGLGLGKDAGGWCVVQGCKLASPIIQGELDSLPHSYICLLQEIHLFGSCWGLINSYVFCDPVINSFSHNCLKTKQCISCFSPSSPPLAMASEGTQQSIRTCFFLPIFLSFPAFLHIPYKPRRKSVRIRVVSVSQQKSS